MPEGSTLTDLLLVAALHIGTALLVFIIGRLVANWIVGFTRRRMERRKLDALIVNFISNILNWALLLLVIILSLNQLGVDTTALVALLAAAGLAIGLALQDSMKNFASGVLLIIFRPFSTGHFVDTAGASGTVERITLFTSTLVTVDNREVIVPNNAIYTGNITNYSARPTRRVDMVFGISYADDLRKAKQLLEQIVGADPRVLADPPPTIAVGELAESSVNFFVQPWVNNADYLDVKLDLTERVKVAFDENGITIPYPQMDVHVQNPTEQSANGNGGVPADDGQPSTKKALK
jgi:small conductance mechanosensitive channel